MQIVETATGKTATAISLPAGSYDSNLALVAGGIVISDPGNLTFYSRDFKKLNINYSYKRLHDHSPRTTNIVENVGGAGLIYATPDQKRFVLFDADGHHASVVVFDGLTLQKTFSGALAEIDSSSISIGDDGFYYTDMSGRRRVVFSDFDGQAEMRNVAVHPAEKNAEYQPIYISRMKWLNVLHKVVYITPSGEDVLYKQRQGEVIYAPAVISSNAKIAAVFKEYTKGGGFWDTGNQRKAVSIVLVPLQGRGRICEIPISPMPSHQFAMNLTDGKELVVMTDATVTAYKTNCAE